MWKFGGGVRILRLEYIMRINRATKSKWYSMGRFCGALFHMLKLIK